MEEITSGTRYLPLRSPQHADDSGLLDCIGDTLSLFGVDSVLDQGQCLESGGTASACWGWHRWGNSECCRTK